MIRHSYFIVLLGHLLLQTDAHCQQDKKLRLSPLPVIYYSPETTLGFGALLAANFHASRDTLNTGSYLRSFFIATLKRQFSWGNTGRIYARQNRSIFQYRFYYAFFPELFYGYQTEFPMQYEDAIEYNRLWLELLKYWQVREHLYAGMYVRFNRIYNIHSDESGSLSTTRPPGREGYHVTGFAPAVCFDSRDSQVYPTNGFYLDVLWIAHPGFIGDYTFGTFKLDVRTYMPLARLRDGVLAFQFFMNLNAGTVPFKDMTELGGADLMRGYYRGYYRYRNYYAFQTEFRMMISERFGFGTWVGAALNSDEWSEPFQHPIRPNAGLGLRYRINRQDKLNVRGDFGAGRHQSGFYLDISEAF